MVQAIRHVNPLCSMILGKFQHEQVAEAGLQASDMFEHSFHMGSLAWNCRQNQKRMRMSRKTMIWQPSPQRWTSCLRWPAPLRL